MSATAAMKASLVLNFEDKLTAGLGKLEKQLDQLKKLGKELGLGKLENAFSEIERTTGAARGLVGELHSVGNAAESAWAKLNRMAGALKRGAFGAGGAGGMGGMMGAVGAVGGGYSVFKALESYSEYSNTLRHTAITAHQYGPDADRMMASLKLRYNQAALDTAQDSHKLAEAGFWMSLTGMKADLVSNLTPLSGKIATAYNADVMDAAKTSFGLNYSMKIGEPDMERALGMLALLGKHGHFLFADQSKSMPGIAAAAQQSHMTGMGSLEEIGAAMQISMKVVDPAQPAMAATNLEQFLSQIQQARDDNTFGKYKIGGHKVDLGGALMDAAGKGISPMEAALSKIKQIEASEVARLHLTDPRKIAQEESAVLSHLFRSTEARTFASAMLHNLPEYIELKHLAHNVSTDMIDKDFHEAMRDLSSQMKLFGSETQQLEDRLGAGFEPVLHGVNYALLDVVHGVKWLDGAFPGLGDDALMAAGGTLAFSAAAGGLALVLPTVGRGLNMFLIGPLRLAAGLLAAVAGGSSAMGGAMLGAGLGAAYLGAKNAERQYGRQFAGETPLGHDEYGVPFFEDGAGKGLLHRSREMPPPINGPSANESARMAHEEGIGDIVPIPSASASASASTGRVDVYVWADPNGVPIIVRTDGAGVNLPQGSGASPAPNPGQTLGRP